MQVVFMNSRDEARNTKYGKFYDAGSEAPKGERFGRAVPGIRGNAKQRRKQLRAIMRQAMH